MEKQPGHHDFESLPPKARNNLEQWMGAFTADLLAVYQIFHDELHLDVATPLQLISLIESGRIQEEQRAHVEMVLSQYIEQKKGAKGRKRV